MAVSPTKHLHASWQVPAGPAQNILQWWGQLLALQVQVNEGLTALSLVQPMGSTARGTQGDWSGVNPPGMSVSRCPLRRSCLQGSGGPGWT